MESITKKLTIAIDGPAGAGKSTASRLLADRLGYLFIDTGATYRSVALIAKRQGVSWQDEAAVTEIAKQITISFKKIDGQNHTFVDGIDESLAIRTPDISEGSSIVAGLPELNKRMNKLWQEMGKEGSVVMEGRDIGTSTFPNANVKIFMTATPETRAKRRIKELATKGIVADFETTLEQIKLRDERDSNRAHSPLKKADDAIEFYTDDLTMEQVVDKLVSFIPRP